MKKNKKIKKIISVVIMLCLANIMIFNISASNTTISDITGEWTLNEHIQPTNPATTNSEILQGFAFTYEYNNTLKLGNGIAFIVIQDTNETIYEARILYNGGSDLIYEGTQTQGGWSSGEFNENFTRNIKITSAFNDQVNLNNIFQWLTTNATKSEPTTSKTYITINNNSTQITFSNGSTWGQWVNSAYNTIGVTTDNTYLYLNNQRMYDNSGNWVKTNQIIDTYGSPGIAYFFRSYNKTFTIYNGETNKTFTYLSTITTWNDYVPTNPDFYIDENKVYYLGETLTQNNIDVRAEDTINNTTYEVRYSDEWYLGYQAGYEQGISLGGAVLDIGSIIDGTITGAKSIFINSFGFELFGINIASTLISILVISIVVYVVKKLR